jgi:hypothetical protein
MGIHTSKRISESGVGAITPATRQYGGRSVMAFVEPGSLNDPEVTVSAAVMVVFARCSSARPEHCAAGGVCAGTPAGKERRTRIPAAAIAHGLTRAGDLMATSFEAATTTSRAARYHGDRGATPMNLLP